MDVYSTLRAVARYTVLGLVGLSLLATPAFPVEYQDSQIFITGFNDYQGKNYQGAIDNMSQLLDKYPESPLRDMAIFWLARSNYKAGRNTEAAKYMAQFYKEYPNSPLKNTVEPELAKMAAAYAKGEPIAEASKPAEEKIMTASAAKEMMAAEKGDAERIAAETAFAERAAAEKKAAEKAAGEKAAAEAAWKERVAAERAASARAAAEKQAAPRAEVARAVPVKQKPVETAAVGGSSAMRAKAIAGYREVIAKYPGTRAAAVAEMKLKEMGVARPSARRAAGSETAANSQIMTLEIEQFADCTLNIQSMEPAYAAGKRFSVPFELVNQGNAPDSFTLDSWFPEDFNSRFVAAANPDTPITVTPQLVPGETFRGMLTGTVPRKGLDGEQVAFPIKAVSQFASEVSQSREVPMVFSAPLLRAVINTDRSTVFPNENVVYHIALLNAGTADAGKVTLTIDHSPHYEPVDPASSGFRREGNGSLAIDGLNIHSGESRDFTVVFRVKPSAPAHAPLSLKTNVVNSELESRESFFSATTVVQEISGVAVRSNTDRMTVIPGQTIILPVVVTNSGNIRDSFRINSDAINGVNCRFYQDLQRNGRRAPDAPTVTTVGPLEPQEEAYLLMEVTTPATVADGSEVLLAMLAEPEKGKAQQASASVSLWFSRPVLELSTMGSGARLKPAEISSYDFTVKNNGSNIAKNVAIHSILPENLEILAADVPFVQGGSGEYVWDFQELGAGEKRTVKVSFRVKTGVPMGTNIQIKNLVSYEDQLGNRY